MSGEDEERDEREGSHSLHRLVMKALVEKRDAERVPQLAGALFLQLLLVMRLHCRGAHKMGGIYAMDLRDFLQLQTQRLGMVDVAQRNKKKRQVCIFSCQVFI